MITLSADNRSLLTTAPYTYLVDNTASGVSTVSVVGTAGFAVDDLILLGLFGSEDAEIFRIGAINTSTGVITLLDKNGASTTTKYSHPESTKIWKIPYNEVRFYWTAALGTIADETPTFDTATPLTGWTDLVASEWFTSYDDGDHSTGFGWFLFRNAVTLDSSQESNAIPYTGFAINSAKFIIDDFLSLLNNRELKLVTNPDIFSWLNEGLALIRNKLNLTNPEYTVSALTSISIVSGTSEYMLASDFADLVEIVDGSGSSNPIPQVTIRQAMSYTGSAVRYYVRGRYIGFVPTPTAATTYSYRYRSQASRVTSYDDLIDLPDNGSFIIKDWMMYRACLKFTNPNAGTYYKAYIDGLNTLIASSVKRDANLDSWGISSAANA